MSRAADTFLTRLGQDLFAAMFLIVPCTLPAMGQDASTIKRFDMILENGRVAGKPRVLQVVRGDQVDILWTTDRMIMLHLHGYDIEITAAPGSPQHMTFTADATGRFPVEIHGGAGRDRILVYVEVHPR
ncbi:hypothetical protein [Microvirga vignae]|nr:hypothetical protein [Microvirga vignae]